MNKAQLVDSIEKGGPRSVPGDVRKRPDWVREGIPDRAVRGNKTVTFRPGSDLGGGPR